MRKKIRAIVIDDEPLSRKKIRILAKDHPDLELVAEGKNTREAKRIINNLNPDLIFLDIKMPDQTGIEFLSSLGSNAPYVIFTTAFSDFAYEAFDLNAVHYLLKPFDNQKFSEAVKRAQERISAKTSGDILNKLKDVIIKENSSVSYPDKLPVKSNNKIELVSVSKIIYLQADKNYVMIITEDTQFRIRSTLNRFQNKLNPSNFLRVHKSYIVNKNYIKELEPVFNQEYIIKLSSGKKIPTGSAYKGNIRNYLT